MTRKHLFLGLLIASFLIAPLFLRAETTTDNIARQIASLRQQVAELQRQLAQLQGQAGRQCFVFNRNLGVGASGREVRELHMVLAKEGLMPMPLPMPIIQNDNDDDDQNDDRKRDDDRRGHNENNNRTDRFTEMTAAAVSAFQLKYKDEILTPQGLSNPTGYVGPATRAKLNQLYGCNRVPPVPGNLPPTISGVLGPTTLNVDQTSTWTVQASDPENGTLNYSVIWGDESTMASGGVASPSSAPVQQTATFTHAYARAGTYFPTFRVTDNSGQSARASLSVVVGQNSPNTVISPNGGEQWVASSTKAITWRYDGATSDTKVDLYLYRFPPCHTSICTMIYNPPIVLDKNISALATYNWIVATDITNNTIPAGTYYVDICAAGSQTNCDSSDNYFRIVESPVACSSDARLCSDGSSVGRVPPSCQFAACP